MEPKNRLLIAITVIVLIVAAMFTSFGRNLFALNTPSVVLPNVNGDGQTGDVSGPQTGLEQYQAVEVTPQTVGSVIRTLSRKDSYYRELTITTFWDGGSSSIPGTDLGRRRLVPQQTGASLRCGRTIWWGMALFITGMRAPPAGSPLPRTACPMI